MTTQWRTQVGPAMHVPLMGPWGVTLAPQHHNSPPAEEEDDDFSAQAAVGTAAAVFVVILLLFVLLLIWAIWLTQKYWNDCPRDGIGRTFGRWHMISYPFGVGPIATLIAQIMYSVGGVCKA